MSGVALDVCLQCGKTREDVKDPNDWPCATADGYEYSETLDEWPRHHWRDWSDAELARYRILPHAFDRYRRVNVYGLPYAQCDDTERGHRVSKADMPEWGVVEGECYDCGRKGLPVPLAAPVHLSEEDK